MRIAQIAQPYDPEISVLLKVCDVHDAPLATNFTSAELLLESLVRSRERNDADG